MIVPGAKPQIDFSLRPAVSDHSARHIDRGINVAAASGAEPAGWEWIEAYRHLAEIVANDPDGHAQDLRRKRHGQVFLEHRQKPDALFGITVRIDDVFFDQGCELAPTEPPSHRRPAAARAGRQQFSSAIARSTW